MNPECFVTNRDFGRDIITDLCSGSQRSVPWGQLDYLQAGFTSTLILAVVLVFLIAAWKLLR